jgi:hypothetical protein
LRGLFGGRLFSELCCTGDECGGTALWSESGFGAALGGVTGRRGIIPDGGSSGFQRGCFETSQSSESSSAKKLSDIKNNTK